MVDSGRVEEDDLRARDDGRPVDEQVLCGLDEPTIDEEVSLRTDLLSACASGLASGIVIKLIQVVIVQMHAIV